MICYKSSTALLVIVGFITPALGQEHQHNTPVPPAHEHSTPSSPAHQHNMPAPQHVDHHEGEESAMRGVLGSYAMGRDASGTSWQPDQAPHGGVHLMSGGWSLMGHASLYGIYSSQSGPRGDDKFFAAGMLMGGASRDISEATAVNLRLMVSPDPFMGRDGYPLLLATGETADGVNHLIDRQHPHELIMELSGTITHRFSDTNSAFLYLGYPGEPALGPPAFMHRASAAANPVAPITHHWLDATHITFGVVTVGFVQGDWKIEASQFTGREPDQFRFNFDPPRLNSTAVRVSWNPDPNWALQASWGHLNSPEQLNPALDEDRITASAQYFERLDGDASIAATLAWGLKALSNGNRLNGAVLEATYKPSDPWSLFMRGEWTQNAELDHTHQIRSVGQISLGAVHDWRLSENWKFGVGVQKAWALVPGSLGYGGSPQGSMAFVRILAG